MFQTIALVSQTKVFFSASVVRSDGHQNVGSLVKAKQSQKSKPLHLQDSNRLAGDFLAGGCLSKSRAERPSVS